MPPLDVAQGGSRRAVHVICSRQIYSSRSFGIFGSRHSRHVELQQRIQALGWEFFLGSVFQASYAPPLNAYVYNYLRRAKAAFYEHDLARLNTLQFLESEGQSPNHYANAIFHWEVYLGQC
jgi:hypothetical protein